MKLLCPQLRGLRRERRVDRRLFDFHAGLFHHARPLADLGKHEIASAPSTCLSNHAEALYSSTTSCHVARTRPCAQRRGHYSQWRFASTAMPFYGALDASVVQMSRSIEDDPKSLDRSRSRREVAMRGPIQRASQAAPPRHGSTFDGMHTINELSNPQHRVTLIATAAALLQTSHGHAK